MTENNRNRPSQRSTVDWFVGGALTRIGDSIDRLMRRHYRPTSSLATTELSTRLRKLLDQEAVTGKDGAVVVPHNIRLKMQWDKFSADSEESLRTLEEELLVAAIDHINDCGYHTSAPIVIEVKRDYFTEGVRLMASFDAIVESGEEEAEVRVSVPELSISGLAPPEAQIDDAKTERRFALESTGGEVIEFLIAEGSRRSVGRTKENDIALGHDSVSKIHAAFVLNQENALLVADTGSTNGTFVNGERISYGEAVSIVEGDTLGFGSLELVIRESSAGER